MMLDKWLRLRGAVVRDADADLLHTLFAKPFRE